MFEQHELYTRLNRRDRPFVKGLRSHDNMGIGRPFFNNPLSQFLGSKVITPCLHGVGRLTRRPIMFQNFLDHMKGIPLNVPFFINDKAVDISSKVIYFARCLLSLSSIDPLKHINIIIYNWFCRKKSSIIIIYHLSYNLLIFSH